MSTTAEDLEMVIRDYWDPWGSRPTELAEALLASKWLAQHDAEVAAKVYREAAEEARTRGDIGHPEGVTAEHWLTAKARLIEASA